MLCYSIDNTKRKIICEICGLKTEKLRPGITTPDRSQSTKHYRLGWNAACTISALKPTLVSPVAA
jgi:hypothetical protein